MAGAALGYAPFAPLVAHSLIDHGILPPSTPEFREGMARGELAGALLTLRPQNPGNVLTAELNASTAAPLTAGAPAAPPLSLVLDGTAVMVLTGGILDVAGAIADMTMALSKGGDGVGGPETGVRVTGDALKVARAEFSQVKPKFWKHEASTKLNHPELP